MASLKQVAERAGVSIGTVSNVITGAAPVSPSLRDRVHAAIREFDYHPNEVARSLKLRRTSMLGIVVPDITNPFYPQLVRGAEDAALKQDYLIITFNTDDQIAREKSVFSVLRRRRVDGILLAVAPTYGDASHVTSTLEAGIPIVCIDRGPPGIPVDSVVVDNAGGTQACVRHLIALGHRRIGIVTGPPTLQTGWERLRGYKAALEEAHIPLDPGLVREGDFRTESGYRLGRELLSSVNTPSALFVCNGMMALGVLKALEELGIRCPEDLALAVFDELPSAEAFHPRLTCVAQPAYAVGYKGAELLIKRLDSGRRQGKPAVVRLPTVLRIGESTLGKGFGPMAATTLPSQTSRLPQGAKKS